jgi:hypothetical protein
MTSSKVLPGFHRLPPLGGGVFEGAEGLIPPQNSCSICYPFAFYGWAILSDPTLAV